MAEIGLLRLEHSQDIALQIRNDEAWQLIHVYPEHEQYPLGCNRYYKNVPNLFVDLLDILQGNTADLLAEYQENHEQLAAAADTLLHGATNVSLKSLLLKVQHVAADGSGNARRFKDARYLFQNIVTSLDKLAITPTGEPIINVRKHKNWFKNQPKRHTVANPEAWYVSKIFARANNRKDAIFAFHSLSALCNALKSEQFVEDRTLEEQQTFSDAMRSRIIDNCNYPTYQEVAYLLNDANMLVFHNDADLAQWIRKTMADNEVLTPNTPIRVFDIDIERADALGQGESGAKKTAVPMPTPMKKLAQPHRAATVKPLQVILRDDEDNRPTGFSAFSSSATLQETVVSVAQCANVLAPKES